jgi:hypothetical protein
MDIEQLYRDHHIEYVTEGHKHARSGWVNTECPFCTGNPGYHLGYDISGNKFVCYRCGGKFAPTVIATLLKISKREASQILRKYGALVGKAPEKKRKIKTKSLKLPPGKPLTDFHKDYLKGRGFDPDLLVGKYQIYSTGNKAVIDNINYKYRIVIPYVWEGNVVSFDTRDVTNKSNNKYMACPEDREETPRKSILYGRPDLWKDVGICVEGPTDVWRMGDLSFAVSGIKYKPAQVRVMAKLFKRVAVIFDDEPQAIIQANKLVAELKFRGVDAFRIDITGDPGALSESEAKYLIKQVL